MFIIKYFYILISYLIQKSVEEAKLKYYQCVNETQGDQIVTNSLLCQKKAYKVYLKSMQMKEADVLSRYMDTHF